MEYIVNDKKLDAFTFIAFVKQVWQGNYDIEKTQCALSQTINITAYELTVDSGTAKLYWLDKGEEKMIADTSKNGTYSVTLDEGDNYLTLEGNDFCGSLQVVVE